MDNEYVNEVLDELVKKVNSEYENIVEDKVDDRDDMFELFWYRDIRSFLLDKLNEYFADMDGIKPNYICDDPVVNLVENSDNPINDIYESFMELSEGPNLWDYYEQAIEEC